MKFLSALAAFSSRTCISSIMMFAHKKPYLFVTLGVSMRLKPTDEPHQPVPEAWSPDAAKLSEAAAAAAARPGGLGVGPRVPLADAYGVFRVLNLTERSITTVSTGTTLLFYNTSTAVRAFMYDLGIEITRDLRKAFVRCWANLR